MNRMYLRLRGWWRLRRGYCPLCNSSPPRPDCVVCRGLREYGPRIDSLQHNVLIYRWILYRRGEL